MALLLTVKPESFLRLYCLGPGDLGLYKYSKLPVLKHESKVLHLNDRKIMLRYVVYAPNPEINGKFVKYVAVLIKLRFIKQPCQ